MRAHLRGGIPQSELAVKEELFAAHGLDPEHLLVDRGDGYVDFAATVLSRSEVKRLIGTDEGVLAKEQALGAAVDAWWREHQQGIAQLARGQQLMQLRVDLLSSFLEVVRPIGVLDRFQVAGVVANWWGDTQNDLKTIAARGFMGLVQSWEAAILNALDDKASNGNGLHHKLVRRLLPEYLAKIEELQAKKADLEAALKDAAGGGPETDDENGEDVAEEVSEEERQAIRKGVAEVKGELKRLQKDFVVEMQKARADLDEESASELVTSILESELRAILQVYVAEQLRIVVATFENWWDKYNVTLETLEARRSEAVGRIGAFTKELGYA